MNLNRLREEMKEARAERNIAREAYYDARLAVSVKKAALKQADARVEELLDLMVDGKSRTPLLDAVERNGEGGA